MKNICGIYKITCLQTGKIYIGSAVNLLKRKQNHFEALANGVHKNIHLQNAYKKYGKSSFVFEVLEMVENKNNLLAREQFWINETKCTNRKVGFNICLIAGSAIGVKRSKEFKAKRSLINKGNKFNLGKKASNELKLKLSAAHKGNNNCIGRILSNETKLKISENNKGKQTMLGKHHNEETKYKISQKRKGIIMSEETKKKMSIAKQGTKLRQDTKEKISKSLLGEKNPMFQKLHSEETKIRMKNNHKGMTGKYHSEETKRKISEAKRSPRKNFLTG